MKDRKAIILIIFALSFIIGFSIVVLIEFINERNNTYVEYNEVRVTNNQYNSLKEIKGDNLIVCDSKNRNCIVLIRLNG